MVRPLLMIKIKAGSMRRYPRPSNSDRVPKASTASPFEPEQEVRTRMERLYPERANLTLCLFWIYSFCFPGSCSTFKVPVLLRCLWTTRCEVRGSSPSLYPPTVTGNTYTGDPSQPTLQYDDACDAQCYCVHDLRSVRPRFLVFGLLLGTDSYVIGVPFSALFRHEHVVICGDEYVRVSVAQPAERGDEGVLFSGSSYACLLL